jgi:muramoyltetrapeptide carboxypeptidase
MVVSTLGTRYEIDTRDAILFLEEINEEPYRIDRMLTQLWLAGKLQTCKAIAFGNFRNCEAKGISITGPSFTLEHVFHERIAPLGVPAIYGLPFGHVKSKLTLPIGIQAELDATKKQLTLLEPATALRSSQQ